MTFSGKSEYLMSSFISWVPDLPCVRHGAVINTHNGNVGLCCGIEPETDERASGNSTDSPMCFTRAQLELGHMKPLPYLSSANITFITLMSLNEPITEQDWHTADHSTHLSWFHNLTCTLKLPLKEIVCYIVQNNHRQKLLQYDSYINTELLQGHVHYKW